MHATGIQKRKEYFLKQNVMYIICLKSCVGTSKTITIIKDKPQISLAYLFISIISIIFPKGKLVFRNRYFRNVLTPVNLNCYFWRVTSFEGSLLSEYLILNGISLFSRRFPGLENCWENFKTFSRIQDSVQTLFTAFFRFLDNSECSNRVSLALFLLPALNKN